MLQNNQEPQSHGLLRDEALCVQEVNCGLACPAAVVAAGCVRRQTFAMHTKTPTGARLVSCASKIDEPIREPSEKDGCLLIQTGTYINMTRDAGRMEQDQGTVAFEPLTSFYRWWKSGSSASCSRFAGYDTCILSSISVKLRQVSQK